MSNRNMSNRKVPCGGFGLDENFLGMNENGELSLVGGASEDKAYKQLVTDGTGKATWEDRLAYDDSVTVIVNSGVQFTKISDEVPSWASIDAPTKVWMSNGNSFTASSEDYGVFGNGSFSVGEFVFFITTDNVEVEFINVVFPKKGVYFLKQSTQYISGIASADSDTPEITWNGSIPIKKLDQKFIPDIPAEKLPDIPVPVIEFSNSISSSIGESSQPTYYVKNLTYSDILAIFNGKNFVIKDQESYYTPLNFYVRDNGTLHVDVLAEANGPNNRNLIYANLACSNGKNSFFRNSYRTITST